MSTTSAPITFSDLYTDLQNRAREQTGVTATENQAKRYINIALQDMHLGQGENFPWAERRAILQTRPSYTTGNVTISQGARALSGGGTPGWRTADNFGMLPVRPGGRVTIAGNPEVYDVQAASAVADILTLTRDYIDSDVSSGAYVYFEDEYKLAADFLRPIDQQHFDEAMSIDLIGRTEFRRRYPRNNVPGNPKVATIIDLGYKTAISATITTFAVSTGVYGTRVGTSTSHGLSDGDGVTITGTTNYNGNYDIIWISASTFDINIAYSSNDATGTVTRIAKSDRRIRFAPPPDSTELVRYAYVTSNLAITAGGTPQQSLINDTDEPIVPLQYRHAIVLHALASWYRDKKDDARYADVAREYSGIMLRIIADNEIGSSRPQFRPRLGLYRRRAKHPWGGPRGRYDINGKFDRLEW